MQLEKKSLKRSGVGAVVVAAFLFLGSCASGGGAVSNAPDWVLQRPQADREYRYFVGAGEAAGGSLVQAQQAATNAMISDIIRYIGVDVTTNSTATARSDLESFEAELVEQVQQQGEAVVSGFEIIDSFVMERDGAVTVYLLGRYEKGALDEEQRRFRALFQERIDAVDVPAEQGRRLYDAGEYARALPFLLEAAAAAGVSDIDNAEIRFDENITLARQLIESIVFEPVTSQINASLNQAVGQSFGAMVYAQHRGQQIPISGLPVRVSYREARGNGGRMTVRTSTVYTDDQGVALFDHPVPNFVGSSQVSMTLDISASVEPLLDLPRRYQAQVEALEDAAVDTACTMQLVVASAAAQAPTAVLIMEMDADGNPLPSQATGDAFRAALLAQGFFLETLDIPAYMLSELSDQEFLELMRIDYGDSFDRVIFARVSVQEVNDRSGVIVGVGGTFQAVDLQNRRVLYSISPSIRGRGRNLQSAMQAAFRSLGTSAAEQFLNNLP